MGKGEKNDLNRNMSTHPLSTRAKCVALALEKFSLDLIRVIDSYAIQPCSEKQVCEFFIERGNTAKKEIRFFQIELIHSSIRLGDLTLNRIDSNWDQGGIYQFQFTKQPRLNSTCRLEKKDGILPSNIILSCSNNKLSENTFKITHGKSLIYSASIYLKTTIPSQLPISFQTIGVNRHPSEIYHTAMIPFLQSFIHFVDIVNIGRIFAFDQWCRLIPNAELTLEDGHFA